VTIIRSTISGNGNSGVFLRGKGSRAIVENSTISGNVTAADGGGLYVAASTAKLVGSTVVSNTAQGFGGYTFVNAGARVRSESTILADNVHMTSIDNECALGGPSPPFSGPGRFVSRGFNLIEDACAVVGAAALDVTGQDPVLGPLQNNGGPTFMHAVMGGSPALAVVTRRRDCETPDQRGGCVSPFGRKAGSSVKLVVLGEKNRGFEYRRCGDDAVHRIARKVPSELGSGNGDLGRQSNQLNPLW